MKKPSLTDFGLTEEQVSSAQQLQKNKDNQSFRLFLAWFPICIVVLSILIGISTGNVVIAIIAGSFLGIFWGCALFIPWLGLVSYITSRNEGEYSQILKKHHEFTMAVENYQRQILSPPAGFTEQVKVGPKQQIQPQELLAEKPTTPTGASPRSEVKSTWPTPAADSLLPPAEPPYIPPAGWNPTPVTPFLHEGLRHGTEKLLSGEIQADAGSIIPSKTSKPRKARNPRPKKEPAIKEDLLPEHFSEGTARQITLTRYERDPRARRACLDHHGFSCNVCGTNLEEKYGELGEGVIQVHHLRPLSTIAENHEINPIIDLIPVCPDCHVILHRKTPPLTPDEIRQLLINQGRLKTPSETSAIKKRKPQPAKATVIKQPRAVSAKKPKDSSQNK